MFTVTLMEQLLQTVYGVWRKSSDKTTPKNIPTLSKDFYAIIAKEPATVLPFFVLSKDYDTTTGSFNLFIDGQIAHERLYAYALSKGVCTKMSIKPKVGFLWGVTVGEAKRWFYTKWLPSSDYDARNMEYELHTGKSIGRKPEIELFFAILKKR